MRAFGNVWADVVGASEKEIDKLVKTSGCDSVDPYVISLLLKAAGGKPTRACFFGNNMDVRVGRVLFCSGDSANSIRNVLPHTRDAGLFPFAVDNGNSSFFCTRSSDCSVVYFYMDREPRSGVVVAESAMEFVEGLVECPY